jgi:hypothetical protein
MFAFETGCPPPITLPLNPSAVTVEEDDAIGPAPQPVRPAHVAAIAATTANVSFL